MALGQIGEIAHLRALLPLLGDRSFKVRKAAIKGVVAILLRTEPRDYEKLPITMSDLVFDTLPDSPLSAREFLEEHIDRQDSLDWVSLGALYLEESLAVEAFDALNHAYELDPLVFTDDYFYYLWEQIHYIAGLSEADDASFERDIAGDALRIMMALRPDDGMVMLNYGSHLASVGDIHNAYLTYRKALLMNPNDHFVTANLTALPLSTAQRRRLDRQLTGDNVRFLPPQPNMGSDGVMSYRGQLVQIQIPNPPFRQSPDPDDELLSQVVTNFLNHQGIVPSQFDIYQAQLVDVSQGAPALFVDVVLREEHAPF